MFETLFSYPAVLRRHRDGPLAAERAAYLGALVAQGMARETVLCRAAYCLCVAVELERWPAERLFDVHEVDQIADEWAARHLSIGRASSLRWPKEHFRLAATDFLRCLGRLLPAPAAPPGQYDAELDDFICAQQEGRWQSDATCRAARWQITRFLDYHPPSR